MEGGFDSHTFPQDFMKNSQKFFNYIFKIIWIATFFLIIFLDRNNFYMVVFTIFILLFITVVTVVRSLNSRNEWREIIEDGDVEIKDKISF